MEIAFIIPPSSKKLVMKRSKEADISEIIVLDDSYSSKDKSGGNVFEIERSSQTNSNIFSSDSLDWRIFDDNDFKNPKVIYSEQEIVEHEFVDDLNFEGVYMIRQLGITLSIMCYRDSEEKTLYCIHRSFKSEQSALYSCCITSLINIGLLSFLIQLFHGDDMFSLIVLGIQFFFIVGCVIRLCVLRVVYTRIINRFRKSITENEQLTTLAFVRADSLCLKLSVKSRNTQNDLSYKATMLWVLRVVIQLLAVVCYIGRMLDILPQG